MIGERLLHAGEFVFKRSPEHPQIMTVAIQLCRHGAKRHDTPRRPLRLRSLHEAQQIGHSRLSQGAAVGKKPVNPGLPGIFHQGFVGALFANLAGKFTKRDPFTLERSVGRKVGFSSLPEIAGEIVAAPHPYPCVGNSRVG